MWLLGSVFFLLALDSPVDIFRLERQIVDSDPQSVGDCIAYRRRGGAKPGSPKPLAP